VLKKKKKKKKKERQEKKKTTLLYRKTEKNQQGKKKKSCFTFWVQVVDTNGVLPPPSRGLANALHTGLCPYEVALDLQQHDFFKVHRIPRRA